MVKNSKDSGNTITKLNVYSSDNHIKDGIIDRFDSIDDVSDAKVIMPYPKSIKIGVSASCDLRCRFCYHYKSGIKGEMNGPDFQEVAILCRKYKIPQVGLVFLGEPTLHKSLDFMIYLLKHWHDDYSPYVFYTTNGLGDMNTYRGTIASGVDSIKFSINAYNPDEFDKMCHPYENKEEAFYTILHNLENTYRLSRKYNTKVYASTVVDDVNNIDPKMKEFIDNEVAPYTDEHYYFQANNQGGLIKNNKFAGITGCSRLPKYPCPRLFNNAYITHDLKVVMCCAAFTDEFVLGDLHEQSFEEIWNGEKMQELRRAHLNGNLSNTICGTDRKGK